MIAACAHELGAQFSAFIVLFHFKLRSDLVGRLRYPEADEFGIVFFFCSRKQDMYV